jgi:hypothetical protein
MASEGRKKTPKQRYNSTPGKKSALGFTDEKMEEELYQKVDSPIPYLAKPGDSVEIPISLIMVAPHKEVMESVHGLCERFAEDEYLFFKGVSHMKAVEMCPSTGMKDLVTCGGQDAYEVDNPLGPVVDPAPPIVVPAGS